MSFEIPVKSFPDIELVPATASPDADSDVRVYILLPTLEELLGAPDFGQKAPIFLPGHRRPLDGWAMFGSLRDRGLILH